MTTRHAHRPTPKAAGFIPTADERRINKAINDVENSTSGEVVAVVTSESDSYLFAPILWAALIALVVAWPLIYLTWMPVQWIYIVQIGIFAALTLLLSLRPLRYALVPKSIKHERAHARAVEQFLVQNLHTTEGRTGVLIFVSVAERFAEILADSAIHKAVPADTWQSIVDEMTAEIQQGRTADGFIRAIETTGKLLAKHFPPGTGPDNILTNHLIVLN
ncbi:MAG: TPM domain-containing protein [Hyphomicrobiaceae bacterium]